MYLTLLISGQRFNSFCSDNAPFSETRSRRKSEIWADSCHAAPRLCTLLRQTCNSTGSARAMRSHRRHERASGAPPQLAETVGQYVKVDAK